MWSFGAKLSGCAGSGLVAVAAKMFGGGTIYACSKSGKGTTSEGHFCFCEGEVPFRLAVVSFTCICFTSICFATMATAGIEVGVVYKVITCTCGMKFHCVKTDDVQLDTHNLLWRIFSHIESNKENHTPTSWDDLALTPHMVTPTRCMCYGRKDCSPEDDRRILCETCGRWFRRRIAGGSDSTMSHRDYSPKSSFSD